MSPHAAWAELQNALSLIDTLEAQSAGKVANLKGVSTKQAWLDIRTRNGALRKHRARAVAAFVVLRKDGTSLALINDALLAASSEAAQ